MTSYQWGTLLIMLGVLVWVPFVIQLLRGEDPPFFYYLPIHLAGVLTGAYMRRGHRAASSRTRRIGNIMVYTGVSVWFPYFGLKSLGYDPETLYFLPFHLTGVIPGVILRYYSELRRLWGRLTGQRAPIPGAP